MKILYLTPGCFDKGGISRYSRYQIEALRLLYGDKSIRVLSLLGPAQDDYEDEFHVHWHGVNGSKFDKLRFIIKIIIEAIIWRPTIIHTAHVNFSGLAHFVSYISNSKTLLNTYGREVWSGLRKDAKWGLVQTHHVISDCHSTADYLEKEAKYRKSGTTKVFWDCVDLQRFKPADVNNSFLKKYAIPSKDNQFIVMTLGRLSKEVAYKGYSRLLLAFSELVKKESHCILIIAGKGTLSDDLKQEAKKLDIGSKVIFTGSVSESELADCYRSAHVFSLISEQGDGKGEGIPLTPLEAMACGIPILVGNQDGSREAVEENFNGFILDPKDNEGLVEKLFLIAKDESTRKRLSLGALDIAKKQFSFDGFVKKHKELYKKIETG